jgi:hypothetical protein
VLNEQEAFALSAIMDDALDEYLGEIRDLLRRWIRPTWDSILKLSPMRGRV